jgi:VanZ family protein
MIPAVLWTAFIVYALLSEPSAIPKYPWLKFPGVDKLIHALLFGIESILLVWAIKNRPARFTVQIAAVWSIILGGGSELLQYYCVEGRSGDLFDLAADLFGGLLGAIVVTRCMKN